LCLAHNLQFRIKGYQLIISLRHFGNDGHAQRTLRLHTLQIFGHSSHFFPSQVSPKVQFPREQRLGFVSIAYITAMTTVNLHLALSLHLSGELRQKVGNTDTFLGSHLLDTGSCNQHVFVIFQSTVYQSTQRAVRINCLPLFIGYAHAILLLCQAIRQCHLRTHIALAHLA